MAAVQGHLSNGADGPDGTDAGGEDTPPAFRHAVAALRGVRVRPEVELDPTPPPRRLAPYSYALEAVVTGAAGDDEELAEGRLILLHDPAGHDAWRGTFRLVTLVHADLEPEIAADPLLPEVCWSWLTGALEARGLPYGEPSGTVTRASSHYFGAMGEREPSTRIEIRASWTPSDHPPPEPAHPGPRRPEPAGEGAAERLGVPDTAGHLAAWCDLLCQIAGLPPAGTTEAGVVSLPQRRGPQAR
ncbi:MULTISPECIES: DUF3000 domain-containing protein [unclassified Streptomyces]|uniref:DUF3000 domain-containing protein n=1 Tax=unclassified Streptomyces TaxID=2593676 RepID=UPI00168B7B9E|nr:MULTISPECIES: DUF3000 domain-containing protein [unclassified Streptomyces]MBD3010797.1 DUF3000 domain-containing protein [Streptomyces sp. 5-10]